MAYYNGKEILFSPHIHTDPASEYKLQQAREEGKAAGWDEFWDGFQNNGHRVMYNTAFTHWGAEYIRPKYKVKPTNMYSCNNTFYENRNLKKLEAAYFDFSEKEKGTTQTTGYASTFYGCSELTEIEDVGLVPQYAYHQTFYNCKKLKTITKMGVDVDTKFNNAFYQCYALENLKIDGKIGQNGFDVKHCTKLSRASIESVINALTDDGEHLNTISNPTITLSKTAVENAFPQQDCLTNATYSDGITEGGLTITNNGDGSFTLNGTYDGGETGRYLYLFNAARVMLPQIEGVYSLWLDGTYPQNALDVCSDGGLYFPTAGTDKKTPSSDPTTITIIIKPNVEINNLTIRPKLVRDDWANFTNHISHFWEIKEE